MIFQRINSIFSLFCTPVFLPEELLEYTSNALSVFILFIIVKIASELSFIQWHLINGILGE